MTDQETRNMFAAAALEGLISHSEGVSVRGQTLKLLDYPQLAFKVADAMLEESKKYQPKNESCGTELGQ